MCNLTKVVSTGNSVTSANRLPRKLASNSGKYASIMLRGGGGLESSSTWCLSFWASWMTTKTMYWMTEVKMYLSNPCVTVGRSRAYMGKRRVVCGVPQPTRRHRPSLIQSNTPGRSLAMSLCGSARDRCEQSCWLFFVCGWKVKLSNILKVPDTRRQVLGNTGKYLCSSTGIYSWYRHVIHHLHKLRAAHCKSSL